MQMLDYNIYVFEDSRCSLYGCDQNLLFGGNVSLHLLKVSNYYNSVCKVHGKGSGSVTHETFIFSFPFKRGSKEASYLSIINYSIYCNGKTTAYRLLFTVYLSFLNYLKSFLCHTSSFHGSRSVLWLLTSLLQDCCC